MMEVIKGIFCGFYFSFSEITLIRVDQIYVCIMQGRVFITPQEAM